MINIDTIGTPFLALFTLIELLLSIYHREKQQTKDILANLTLGLLTIITGFFIRALALFTFSYVYSYSLFKPAESVALWIVAFFLCDLVLYFYHLLGHKTRLFWAAHVAHHSSLHYNISVGFRINFIHLFYRFLFWAPLCLIGIQPHMILFLESLTAIWNFIIHTEKIKKLGVIDKFLNTPSNHRVHHASNPEYLDKNMGGILIIYDRFFGTYARETTKPIYGITHNIHTHNPSTILFHEYRDMLKALADIKGWKNKIIFLFSKPTGYISKEENSNAKQNPPKIFSPIKNAI